MRYSQQLQETFPLSLGHMIFLQATLLVSTLALAATAGPPAVRREGVVNGASQRPTSVGGAISPGSLISIHGVGFGADGRSTSVWLISGGRKLALNMTHITPTQIDAWIPAEAPRGPAQLIVRKDGQDSAPAPVTLRAEAFGLFSANGKGWGPARSANGPEHPVAPGGQVTLFGTGLAAGQGPKIRIAGLSATVLSISRLPFRPIQLTVQVPPDSPEGCFVPVSGGTPGGPASTTVTIAVRRGGGPCTRSPDDVVAQWLPGKTAVFVVSRTVTGRVNPASRQVEDRVSAGFADVPASRVTNSPLLMSPPVGACTAYGTTLDPDTPGSTSMTGLFLDALSGVALDPGNVLRIDNGEVQLRMLSVSGAANVYQRMLGGDIPTGPRASAFALDSGVIHVTGTGGRNVGRFSVTLPAPQPFQWGNRAAFSALDRSRPVKLAWSGAGASTKMAILLSAASTENNVAGLIYCLAPAGAGRFTVPSELLAVLPSGRGEIRLISSPGSITAGSVPGIDHVVPLSLFVHVGEFHIP